MPQPDMKVEDTQNGLKPKQVKPRRERKYRSISGSSSRDMTDMKLECKVDGADIDWQSLPTTACFTLTPGSPFVCVKDSKSSYIDLKLGKREIDIASGRVYRVYF